MIAARGLAMKHCPNPDCRHRLRIGKAAEYRDEIDACADCGTALEDGPAPVVEERPAPPGEDADEAAAATDLVLDIDDGPLVTVGTYFHPHTAQMARAQLASVQVPSVVLFETFPWRSAIDWVWLQVPQSYAADSFAFLHSGGTEPPDEAWEREALLLNRDRHVLRALRFALFVGVLYAFLAVVFGAGAWYMALDGLEEFASVPDDRIVGTAYDGTAVTAGQYREELEGLAVRTFLPFGVVGAVFIGVYFWGRRSPVAAMLVALCVLWATQVFEFWRDPLGFVAGAWGTLFYTCVFLGGMQWGSVDPDESDE